MKILVGIVLILLSTTLPAQKIDAKWGKAWAKLHNNIYSLFQERSDTTFINQVCFIGINMENDTVKQINVISQNDSLKNQWVLNFLSPLQGKRFIGFAGYKYLLVPLKTARRDSESDEAFLGFGFFDSFVRAFKNTASKNVIICRGVHLEPPAKWIH